MLREEVCSLVKKLLDSILVDSEEYKKVREEFSITIESILLKEDDPEERFLNHFWYTIIDQRRDVKDFVIPMMASLMIGGFNPDFAVESPALAKEIVAHVLSAYGHELRFSQVDMDRLQNDGFYSTNLRSRSDSVVDVISEISSRFSWEGDFKKAFKSFIMANRKKLMLKEKSRKSFVEDLPYISSKSFHFFLRDIEPILEDPYAIPIPVDSNVAQSIQKTGLMYDEWPPKKEDIVSVGRRQEADWLFANRIRLLVSNKNSILRDHEASYPERIVLLAQALFLIGAVYCQNCPRGNQTIDCSFKENCMLNRLIAEGKASEFLKRLGAR